MSLRIERAARDDWQTPDWLFNMLHREFNFTVDGAASADNAKLPRYWSKEDSAFSHPWEGERLFINPPFDCDALTKFSRRAVMACNVRRIGGLSVPVHTNTIVAMVTPIKADQVWWHQWVMLFAEVRFILGRIAFKGADNCFPGPIAVVVWGAGEPGTMKTLDPKGDQQQLFTREG